MHNNFIFNLEKFLIKNQKYIHFIELTFSNNSIIINLQDIEIIIYINKPMSSWDRQTTNFYIKYNIVNKFKCNQWQKKIALIIFVIEKYEIKYKDSLIFIEEYVKKFSQKERCVFLKNKIQLMNVEDFINIDQIDHIYEVIKSCNNETNNLFLLRINSICNEKCLFCPMDNNSQYLDIDFIKLIIDKIYQCYFFIKKITLTGGEPTLHPQYCEIIDYIILKNSSTEIEIQTNATNFYINPQIYKKYSQLTNLYYYVSFHSHKKSDYDIFTNTNSHYYNVVNGVKQILICTKNNLSFNFLINSINIKYLSSYIIFIEKEFTSIRPCKLYLTNLFPPRDNNSYTKNLYVKYSESIDIINKIIISHTNKSLIIYSFFDSVTNFPICILWFKLRYIPKFKRKINKNMFSNRFKSEKCENCFYKDNCIGVPYDYINLFGDDEFQPILKNSKKKSYKLSNHLKN